MEMQFVSLMKQLRQPAESQLITISTRDNQDLRSLLFLSGKNLFFKDACFQTPDLLKISAAFWSNEEGKYLKKKTKQKTQHCLRRSCYKSVVLFGKGNKNTKRKDRCQSIRPPLLNVMSSSSAVQPSFLGFPSAHENNSVALELSGEKKKKTLSGVSGDWSVREWRWEEKNKEGSYRGMDDWVLLEYGLWV